MPAARSAAIAAPPVDLRGCTLQRRDKRQLPGGAVLIVDRYAEYPRLARVTRRGPCRARQVTWCVDGQPARNLDHALRRLAGVPTQEELPL